MSAERVLVVALLAPLAAAWALARRPRALAMLAGLVVAGIVALLGWRWTVTGHPPVFGTYEMDLAETAALLGLGLYGMRRWRWPFPRAALAVAGLTLLHTFLLDPAPTPLTISEVSLWIDLHAVLAWCAWALLFHALFRAFAPADEGELGLRLLGWGFAALTAMGAVGVYYGTLLFATPWSWDPVQTLGLLAWILAAIALHFRLFFRVTLDRQRWFLLVVVAVFVLSAKLVMFLPAGQSFHVFELGALAPEAP